ncbi:MAG: ABC transporter substrate-binding protein [Clostridia bacterium]|nr:ABC transporter substrate-binding protein [Clostridia bacterium]
MQNLGMILLILMLLMSVVGCSTQAEESENLAGVYEGTVKGYHGDITAKTKLDAEGRIVDVQIKGDAETKGSGQIALEKIGERILVAQSLKVDVVSGATVSSYGAIDAVAKSLEQAGLNSFDYNYAERAVEEDYPLPEIDKSTMPVALETRTSVTITDVKGREVVINLPISSYAISTMDVIEYVIPLKGEKAFDMLVGSGQDGGHGLNKYAELYTPVVGDYMTHVGQISDHNAPFDLEMILSMNPDVLIVNSAMGAHKYAMEIEDQLTAAGIKIVLIDVPGKALEHSAQQTMTLLGKIFGEETRASEVSSFLDEQYELIAEKELEKREDKPTVYYEKSGYSEVFGSTSTSAKGWGSVIRLAGGDNIADPLLMNTAASGGSNNTLDPEYVIDANPDFIIVSGINDGWLSITNDHKESKFDIVNRVGWADLKAIQNHDLYEFAHSTSRQIYAFYPTLKAAKLFYPEEFETLDPEAVLEEFFDRFMLLDTNISTWFTSLDDC